MENILDEMFGAVTNEELASIAARRISEVAFDAYKLAGCTATEAAVKFATNKEYVAISQATERFAAAYDGWYADYSKIAKLQIEEGVAISTVAQMLGAAQ